MTTDSQDQPITVYISIGNSDDKLTQADWHDFYVKTTTTIRLAADTVHGQWVSEPASAWQNACWCVEINPSMAERLRGRLAALAADFQQDSIAWADVPTTIFIAPAKPVSAPCERAS